MKWSVSFAIGLWANAILKGNVPAFFILVALLNVVLSPSALGRTVIHAGIGWLAYLLLFSPIEPTKVSRPTPFTERVVVIPRFVPTTSQEDDRSSRHGLCDVVGKSGYMGRHWLRTELELDGAPLLAWTRFERVQPYDMAYGFDFPAYLNRLGAGGLA